MDVASSVEDLDRAALGRTQDCSDQDSELRPSEGSEDCSGSVVSQPRVRAPATARWTTSHLRASIAASAPAPSPTTAFGRSTSAAAVSATATVVLPTPRAELRVDKGDWS